jgi:hypothetical protein
MHGEYSKNFLFWNGHSEREAIEYSLAFATIKSPFVIVLDDDPKNERLNYIAPTMLEKVLDGIEGAWRNKPTFQSEEATHRYIDTVHLSLSGAQAVVDRYHLDFQKNFADSKLKIWDKRMGDFEFSVLGIAMLFLIGAAIYTGWLHGWEPHGFLKGIFTVFVGAGLIGILIVAVGSIPHFVLRNWYKKKLMKKALPTSEDMARQIDRFHQFKKRVEEGTKELLEDARHNKALYRKARLMEVQDAQLEKQSQLALRHRLELIEKEAHLAKEAATTIEEQHSKTEEIRSKYSQELVALQKKIKSEADEGLMAKLLQVQRLLEGSTV